MNVLTHPTAFPDVKNPREVRALMHTIYDRYIHGHDLFPKIRLSDPELLSRKSKDIGRLLFNAWSIIDEDNRFFDQAIEDAVVILGKQESPNLGSIVTTVGRNAVNFAFIETVGDGSPVKVIHGIQDRQSFTRYAETHPQLLSDGRVVSFANGHLQPQPTPEAVIYRRSNAASIFFAGRSQSAS